MIRVSNVRDLDPDKYDENWMIVRKPDFVPKFVRHEPLLSPSPDLFRKYREAFEAGHFDQNYFDIRDRFNCPDICPYCPAPQSEICRLARKELEKSWKV